MDFSKMTSSNLIDSLYKDGMFSKSVATMLMSYQRQWGMEPYSSILETNVLSEDEITGFFATRLDIPRIDTLTVDDVDKDTFSQVNFTQWHENECIPINTFKDVDNKISVLFTHPTCDVVEKISLSLGHKVIPYVSKRNIVLKLLNQFYMKQMVNNDK